MKREEMQPADLNDAKLAEQVLRENTILFERIAAALHCSHEEVPAALREVVRFLLLVAHRDSGRLTPSHRVDLAWHEFILCTRAYQEFCETHFGTLIHHYPGGSDEQNQRQYRETFCAITILQQTNVVMRSMGIDNVVRLAKDDTVLYEDTQGEEGDLRRALDQFAAGVTPDDVKLFNTLHLVLEHHTSDLACLLDIRILRTHAVGQYPIKITVNGLPNELGAEEGEDQVRRKMKSVFGSQSSYDTFVTRHRQSFITLLDRFEDAFKTHMRIDNVRVSSSVRIIRPSNRIDRRSDIPPATGDYYDYDPVFHDGYGFGDASFFAWLWADHCHCNDIRCQECTIVDSTGTGVLEVGTEGFQAGEHNTMNVDEPFSSPEGADIRPLEGGEFAAEIADDSQKVFDSLGGGTESGGWLSSFGDSFDGDSDGGSACGGSSCGGGCGGE